MGKPPPQFALLRNGENPPAKEREADSRRQTWELRIIGQLLLVMKIMS